MNSRVLEGLIRILENQVTIMKALIRVIDNQMEIKNHIGINHHTGYVKDNIIMNNLENLVREHDRESYKED